MKDQPIRLHDGWYAFVNGRLFGTYDLKEYAQAAIPVEQRRAAKRTENKRKQV